jgi:hypothetical protein
MRVLSSLKTEQDGWVSHWKDLSENFMPRRGRALFDQNRTNRGEKLNRKMIDPTPGLALRTLASGMMAGLTSPARPWFRLVTPDTEMMEFGPVREWLWAVENKLREIYAKSNFYNSLFICYKDLGCIGTHAQIMLEDREDVIRCYPFSPGRYYLATSSRQVVDTIFRDIPMTARQVVMEFGIDNVSERTKSLYNNVSTREQWVQVIQAIKPNTDREYGKADNKNLPYYTCYFEADSPDADEKLLRESGFYEFPGLAPRWDLAEAEDIYGSSPAMDVLGGSRALQLQQKRKAQAIDKHVDPPMAAHPDLKHQRTSLLPGDVTYTPFSNTGGAPGFQPVYQIKPEISALLEDIQEMKSDIRSALYVDLFLMLTMSDRREITAEEVRERHEEKLLMLGPVLERLNGELLDPAIDRTFAIALRAGLIPEPPEELQGTDLKIEYISILAQAQRLVATQGIERLTAFAGVLAQGQAAAQQPVTAFDKIDIDECIDEYGYALGVPPKLIRSDDEVVALRDAKAEAQQAEQMAAAAQPLNQAAGAVKSLSEAEVGGQSALEAVAGG